MGGVPLSPSSRGSRSSGSTPSRRSASALPLVTDLKLVLRFPAYMQEPDEVIPGSSGDVLAPKGTEVIVEGRTFPLDWSPDGRRLLYLVSNGDTGLDVFAYDIERRTTEPVLNTPFNEDAAVFSPDGQWLVTGAVGGYRVWSTETWKPVHVFYENNYIQAIAGMRLYDVLLVNSVIDGMNLVAKEGPVVNTKDGVLILSEAAGAFEHDSTIRSPRCGRSGRSTPGSTRSTPRCCGRSTICRPIQGSRRWPRSSRPPCRPRRRPPAWA